MTEGLNGSVRLILGAQLNWQRLSSLSSPVSQPFPWSPSGAADLLAKLIIGMRGGLKISWHLKHVGSTQARQLLLACQALCYVVIWGCSDEARVVRFIVEYR